LSTHQVAARNWSGDNILPLTNKDIAINLIKTAINIQDFDIWRTGVLGLVHGFRRMTRAFIETSWFNNTILISVLLNTIVLATVGLIKEGSSLSGVMSDLNFAFTVIFTVEMVLKLIGLGITGKKRKFPL